MSVAGIDPQNRSYTARLTSTSPSRPGTPPRRCRPPSRRRPAATLFLFIRVAFFRQVPMDNVRIAGSGCRSWRARRAAIRPSTRARCIAATNRTTNTVAAMTSDNLWSGRRAGTRRMSRAGPTRTRHHAGRVDQRHPVIVSGQHQDLSAAAGDIPAPRHPLNGLASHTPRDRSPIAAPTRPLQIGWDAPAKRARSGASPGTRQSRDVRL
jgi:hypothetical protein